MDLEPGDDLLLEDDSGNERIVRVESVEDGEARVDLYPGMHKQDVRRLDPDEWSIKRL